MSTPERPNSRKSVIGIMILKGLFLYAFFPVLCLTLLAQRIGDGARSSDWAAFCILFAAAACVCLNWLAYTLIHRKRPSLPVLAWGTFCLLLVVIIEQGALPAYESLTATLATIGGCLVLAILFLLSFWFAARRSRPAHVIAVGCWITVGVIAVLMLFRVIRQIESRTVSRDTWISIVILAALIPAAFSHRILSSCRRKKLRAKATGQAAGKIIQMIGETHLDRDDDLVTLYHARVQYTVDDVPYETRADISGFTMRRFGRKRFIGREIPVFYDPENPGKAFTNRIDRHIFDNDKNENPDDEDADQIDGQP